MRPQYKRPSSTMHVKMPRLGSITEMREVGKLSPLPNVKFDYFSYEESSLEKPRASIEVIKKEVKTGPKASTKSGLCDICFEQACQPRRTRCCGDIFCAEHLADWVESRRRCPTCEKPISFEDDSISLVPTPKFTLSPTKSKNKPKQRKNASRQMSARQWSTSPVSSQTNSEVSLIEDKTPSPPPPYAEVLVPRTSEANAPSPRSRSVSRRSRQLPYAETVAVRARLSEDIGNVLMLVGAILTTVTLILIVLDLGENYGAPQP